MNEVTLIGIDPGKHSFHLHAQDATGRMVFRKKLSRQQLLRTLANVPSCRVVMEACAGSHWLARQFAGMGHEPRLISPQFVRPFDSKEHQGPCSGLLDGTVTTSSGSPLTARRPLRCPASW